MLATAAAHTAAHPQAAFETTPQPQLRPVRAADLPAMRQFVLGLSSDSRGLRFHGGVNPSSERLLTHLTQADGRRHIALVAVLRCDDGDVVVGEARCVRGADGEAAEFAISVADAWQGRGLARQLLAALLAAAAQAGMDTVVGDVLTRNGRMGRFMQQAGFVATASDEAGVQRWVCQLLSSQPEQPASQALESTAPAGWMAWVVRQLAWTRPAARAV